MSTTKEITRNLGGDRLGSGNKNNINLHAYNRSTHDLSRTWRSSMNVGTLVPFFVEVGLNGDSMSINLDNITRTLPSRGPLYGSYKLQIDMFECPIRLYNGLLHNNMTGIGLNMSQVKFPKIEIQTKIKNREFYNEDLNKSQISKSSLINYLGLNGVGDGNFGHGALQLNVMTIKRKFNAIPLIAYWDIYKNYYANKQEEKGALICANPTSSLNIPKEVVGWNPMNGEFKYTATENPTGEVPEGKIEIRMIENINSGWAWLPFAYLTEIRINNWKDSTNTSHIQAIIEDTEQAATLNIPITNLGDLTIDTSGDITVELNSPYAGNAAMILHGFIIDKEYITEDEGLNIKKFELEDIDEMRIQILKNTGLNNELLVNDVQKPLWNYMCGKDDNNCSLFKYHQHGLGLKTYQSDLFNNWLQTEWIDGEAGINKITAIDTSSGSFEIDALILGKKIYNMLNRVAVSGGSFEDWQEAVYSVKALRRAETPIYRGGMSAEIMFSEVVSNAAAEDAPLGTLAGKGGEHGKKGGQIEISCDEPSIIMGIVSITPRVDYSQGNSWILTELDNMDDLHKPQLDGIGFEDLLQERMAYWGTVLDENNNVLKLAAGKIPAWMNYMTAINETHGDFAEENKCMFMTLNRRYEFITERNGAYRLEYGIADLTTYIDPRKYNYIFNDVSLQAQNFWIQIGIGVNARRVMSAKIIPFA